MSENIPITFKVEPDALFLAMSEENMRLRAENERLRARVGELTDALIDARHNGLIYWSPMTERGAVERAAMMSRIDKVLNKEEGKP